MVERADAACFAARRRPAATKLLFSQGRFERLAPHKRQPATAVTIAVKQPSTSSQFLLDQYCCRRRRALTESYADGEDNLQHERIKEREEQENEGGDGYGVGSIVGNFSILAEGILGLWEGEDSVRRRIEGLGERQQVMKQEIKGAEEVQRDLRERLSALEQQAQEEQVSLRRLKTERLHTLAHNMNIDQYSITSPSPSPSPASSLNRHHLHVNIMARSGASAPTVSSDRNPYVAIFSSRQLVAFEMLEFVHKRLTSHMWAHMWERVSSLQGEEERGRYLRVFRGIEGQSAFGAKPLSEATYTELLGFSKQEVVGGEEVEEALAAAEGRLAKEACKEGYQPGSIGDIRQQITDVYLRCHRHFKSVALPGNLGQYLQLNQCLLQQGASTSKACHQHIEQLIIPDRHSELLHEGLHPDLISRTQEAARLCKLGALQPAAQLIQLGCYLLCKSSSHV